MRRDTSGCNTTGSVCVLSLAFGSTVVDTQQVAMNEQVEDERCAGTVQGELSRLDFS